MRCLRYIQQLTFCYSHPVQARYALTAFTILLGALSSAGSVGVSICVERDWTKAMCGADALALGRMNAVMRRIDLLCLMLAPIASGLLMTYAGLFPAVVIISVYNAVAWMPEIRMLQIAQRHSAALRLLKYSPSSMTSDDPAIATVVVTDVQQQQKASAAAILWSAVRAPVVNLVTGWSTYIRQPVLLPAVALAMLYFTVLSLGFMMTAYVKHQGLTEVVVSIFRAAGALTGILATFLYPWLQKRLGILTIGMLGICHQLLCLLVAVLPVLLYHMGLPGGWSQLGLLYCTLTGVALSRTGLWLFDLCVSQLLQDEVEHSELGE
jgi:iron-regulated transporter 1